MLGTWAVQNVIVSFSMPLGSAFVDDFVEQSARSDVAEGEELSYTLRWIAAAPPEDEPELVAVQDRGFNALQETRAFLGEDGNCEQAAFALPSASPHGELRLAFRDEEAALLNPLCEREAIAVASGTKPIEGDAFGEARRMVDVLGPRMAGYLSSNGQVSEELRGEFPAAAVAARTGLHHAIKLECEKPAGPARIRDAGPETLSLAGSIQCIDLTLKPIVARFGGTVPVGRRWNTAQPLPDRARWGACEGATATEDIERAMAAFGPYFL